MKGRALASAKVTKMTRTISVQDVQGRSIDDLLNEVTQKQETLRVKMAEGEYVEITPLPKLKPLLTFEGYVPEGWKDAIYEPKW
jgi:hypothetical protein